MTNNRDIHDYIDIYLDPLVAIGTFVLGYYLSKIITDRQENSKLTSLLSYFQLYLTNQRAAIDKQIDQMILQKSALKNLNNTSGLSVSLVNQPYYILDSINKESLLQAWTTIGKMSSQKFFDIISHIELTRKIFDAYKDHHSTFINRLNSIQVDWNTKMTELHKLKAALTSNKKEIVLSDPDLKILVQIFNETYKDSENKSFYYAMEKLVNPIEAHFREAYSNNPQNKVALVLTQKAQEIQLVFQGWTSSKDSYDEYIHIIVDELQKSKDKAK